MSHKMIIAKKRQSLKILRIEIRNCINKVRGNGGTMKKPKVNTIMNEY